MRRRVRTVAGVITLSTAATVGAIAASGVAVAAPRAPRTAAHSTGEAAGGSWRETASRLGVTGAQMSAVVAAMATYARDHAADPTGAWMTTMMRSPSAMLAVLDPLVADGTLTPSQAAGLAAAMDPETMMGTARRWGGAMMGGAAASGAGAWSPMMGPARGWGGAMRGDAVTSSAAG